MTRKRTTRTDSEMLTDLIGLLESPEMRKIEERNAYRDGFTLADGTARPFMVMGYDAPTEAMADKWLALAEDVAEDVAEEPAEEPAEDGEPTGGAYAEPRGWYDALPTDWDIVARHNVIERYEWTPNLTVTDCARKDRVRATVNLNWGYGDRSMPLTRIGNPSHGIPLALAAGRRGRGYERTGSRNWGNGAPIQNAITLAASIANGGQAVAGKVREAARKAAETPEACAARRARKAAALKAKRNAAK